MKNTKINEWWRNRETILKNLSSNNDSISLHATELDNGIWEYALVWWHSGSPNLQLLFRNGEIKFDSK